MAHPKEVHDEIRRLRREEKLSYKAIARRTQVPLSTVVWWCRKGDSAAAMTRDELRASLLASQPQRTASIRRTAQAKRQQEVGAFVELWTARLTDPAFVAPLMLYLAEGCSKGNLSICNMDAAVIVCVRIWARREFDVTDGQEVFVVQLNRDAAVTVDQVRDVWSQRLGVSEARITVSMKSVVKRKRTKSREDYAGCCRYSVNGFRHGAIKLKALARHMMTTLAR